MKALTCAATRRRLTAFHDGELSVADQIAVASHLEWCDACAAARADLRRIGMALQATSPGVVALGRDEAAAFVRSVVNRSRAERDESFGMRLRRMSDQPHLLYAAFGATAAAAVCLVIMLGMMRFATKERPDSLAAIVSLLATPLECESGDSASSDAPICRERWAERFQRANEAAEQDTVFTLESMLTTGGQLATLSALRHGARREPAQAKIVEGLLDAMTRARLESGSAPQPPFAVNGMLWLVARETVRATKPVSVPLPSKKRAALFEPIRVARV